MRRRLLQGLLACLCLGWVLPACAQLDIAPLTVTRSINWIASDVVEQVSFCVESFQEAADKKSASPIPFAISASIGGAATPFTLANGAETVPVSMTWTDVPTASTITLTPDVATPSTLTGKLANCPGGNNGLLTLTVLNADLGAVPAGTYTRTFAIEAFNLGSGRPGRRANVTLSVMIPPVIRISNIDDLVLGTFDGVSNMSAADTVCIYKNGGNLYGITASGSGAGGAFTINNGSAVVPYALSWQDNLGTVALAAGVQAANRGNAVTASPSCSGGAADNATVTVIIQAADLMSAQQPGLYSGVLTLMVVPL
jgi:hypothetical protein